MMPAKWKQAIDVMAANWLDREWIYLKGQHGRWAVVERAHPYRARRFSSLARARRFANRAGGVVRRWRTREWRPLGHWQYVTDASAAAFAYLSLVTL